jgi:SPP1 gp7 family putative phage head morphogenesis protein
VPRLRADPPPNSRKPVTIRAIHANAGLHAWYFAELDKAVSRMQAEVSAKVLAAYGQVEPTEYAADAAARNPSLLLRAALRKWGGLWVSRFDKLSLDLSQQFARKSFGMTQTAMRAALKDAGFTVKFAPTPGAAAAYQAVVAEQVNLIKSIPAQYLKDVESKVWNSVMKGGDMHALSKDLRQTYGVTRERAALIARDQNAKAKAIIERTRRQELGITHAIWQHSAGGKVPRATHVAMSGKPYPIAQGMWDSAQNAYVLPGELINCRCTSRAVIPAFETVEQARGNSPRNTPLLNAARARAR